MRGAAVVGASVLGAAVVGAAVEGGDVAALLQVTLHPLAPPPLFLSLLVNSSSMSEEETNSKFLLFPQTLNIKIFISYKVKVISHFFCLVVGDDQSVTVATGLVVLDVDLLASELHLLAGLSQLVVDQAVHVVFVLAPLGSLVLERVAVIDDNTDISGVSVPTDSVCRDESLDKFRQLRNYLEQELRRARR